MSRVVLSESHREASAAAGVHDVKGNERLALWSCTLGLQLALLWLYWPSLDFTPLSLEDQARLASLSTLPLRSALAQVAHGPLRPADNLFFWLMAHSDRLLPWRVGLLCTFLLTVGFVQYFATQRAGGWIAGIASAACFGLSPTTASVVCWLSRAHIGLCAPFILICVKCGQNVLDRSSAPRVRARWTLGALLGLSIALSLYELAVLTPLVLVLYHRLLAPPGIDRATGALYAGSLALVCAFFGLQLASGAVWHGHDAVWALLANSMRYGMQNFLLWLWPWGRFGVSIPDVAGDHGLENAVCWLIFVAALGVLWRMRKGDPRSVYGFLWFSLLLVAASTWLRFEGEPVAGHHLYLPMLGFTFAGARVTLWLLDQLSLSIRPRALRLLVDGVVSIAFFWTFAPLVAEAQRTLERWGDEQQLYLETLHNYPDSVEVLDKLTQRYLPHAPRDREPAAPADLLQTLWDGFLMRPEREPAVTWLARGRALMRRARYVEAGSACALALAAGASAQVQQEAGQTLVQALRQAAQPASAALLEQRLQRSPSR